MSIRRVAVIFDNKARPETTGVYCRRALGTLVEVEHFLPTDLSRIPRGGFDLYLNIDDGLEYRLPPDLRPCACWAIDTHLKPDWHVRKSAAFDLVFAAQRDGAEQLRQAGIASARWLPLACDPEFHRKHDVAKQYDLCFVGNLSPGPRTDLLELLRRRFPNHFVGRCFFEEMARAYSASRLVYNRSILNDINMRVFEALACGSLLLTNDLRANGQEELFGDGLHLATYRDADEMLDKAAFYLARHEVRERIAAAGRAEALARHTYRHRMEVVLAEAERRPVTVPAAPGAPAPSPEPAVPARAESPAAAGAVRDPFYFEFDRPELLAMIPASARRVLDIGCAAGRLGEALKARQPAHVVGLEMDPDAARATRARLDEVHQGDVEQAEPDFAPGSFDTIVCGDVLEHLRDPARLLRRARAWLAPGGQLIASIPNVRHHSVVRGLLDGHWTYEPAGLLDRDHLRFFTRREIEKLFHRAGFTIAEVRAVPDAQYRAWEQAGRPGEVKCGRLHVGGMPPEEAEEFYIYQYLVRAVPAPAADLGLTSLVIVTHNELGYTRRCVDSIRQHTDEPYELIFVDNGSSDGTPEYLRSLDGATLITNADNRGFPAAANQGIQAARGRQVLLLNNDTVVTTGWLGGLLRVLHSDPKIGLVGPCSNCAAGEQRVAGRYEEDLVGLDGFAWDWGHANRGRVVDAPALGGFCLLIRRALVDAIGLLDERFGIGCVEDDDFCLRATRAGWRVVIAREAYLHHFGHRTFHGMGMDFDALAERNRELFRAKWQPGEAPAPEHGLTSIVILTHNQLAYTRLCVESIRRHTPEPHELIFVDNASTDGTLDWLRSLDRAKVIANAENRGFPAAANQGIQAATGRQILLLNNDCVVTPGWLSRLLGALHREPGIGLVGPCSNFVSGTQQVAHGYGDDLAGLDHFATQWGQARNGTAEVTDRLVGFCLLFRREVVDRVGLLDERFGIGCFEDDDFCLRALNAGFRAVIARDAFVHHFGGRTFIGAGVDFAGLMTRNEQLFRAKWQPGAAANGPGAPAEPERVQRYTVRTGPDGGLRLGRSGVHLSLCMIVRDNAATIRACLESIRPWVDEIVVVDTGSKDETPRIAAALGARVYHFPWCDSFSAARNESLRYARGRWIFWMDSDDVIDAANGRKLRELAYREAPPSVLGYVMQVHCPGPGGAAEGDVTVVDHVKLFRNLPHLRFEGRIHEQILPAIRRAGGEVAWSDIFVVHAGYDHSPEGQRRKLERDLRLLHLELQERPEHPFTLFNLGMTYTDAGRYEEALAYLRSSIARAGSEESHLRKAYAYLVSCHDKLGQADAAWKACQDGLRLFPRDAELLFWQGNLLFGRRRLHEAARAYADLLHDAPGEQHFKSVVRGITGHLARHNLALVYMELGELARAEEQWRRILEEQPRYAAAREGLAEVVRRQGRREQVLYGARA